LAKRVSEQAESLMSSKGLGGVFDAYDDDDDTMQMMVSLEDDS
jgi:hypothetical protein